MSFSINIASYNVLSPYFAVKWGEKTGLNQKGLSVSKKILRESTESKTLENWKTYSNWNQRIKKIAHNIELADIVCLQEITPRTIIDILKICQKYSVAGVAYHPNPSQNICYGNAIVFNPKKAHLLQSFEI